MAISKPTFGAPRAITCSRSVDRLCCLISSNQQQSAADWVSQPCRPCQSILEMQTSISNHGCKHTKLTKVAEPKKHEMYSLSPCLVRMQVTCWKLCLTQPHPKSFRVLSVLYLCKFCLDKGCRIKLGAFQRNAFNLHMNMVWQQVFFCLVTFEAAVLFCLL